MQISNGTMKIVGMDWALVEEEEAKHPMSAMYNIECSCGTNFQCSANWRGLVQCPNPACDGEASMRKMAKEFRIGCSGLPRKWLRSGQLMALADIAGR